MNSCLYLGKIRHRRHRPQPHQFTYPLFLLYLDLDELPHLLAESWLWGERRFSPVRFARERYLGDPEVPLKHEVHRFLEERGVPVQPESSVRLLTHPHYLGYGFNPISFYYCFQSEDCRPQQIIAEVTNTPWKEQHCYLLDRSNLQKKTRTWRKYFTDKELHVSPFMPMNQSYRWVLGDPGDRLMAHMESRDVNGSIFDATLRLKRQPLTAATLRKTVFHFPFMTWQVVLAIHFEAARLWKKRVPFHSHPDPSKRKFEVLSP